MARHDDSRRNRVPALKPKGGLDQREKGTALAAYEIDWKDPENIDEQEIRDFIQGQYDDGKQRRQQWESQAAEQLASVRGNSLLRWDDEVRDLVERRDGGVGMEFRDPVTINTLKGYVLQYIAFMVGRSLTFQVDAASRDDDDVSAARVASKVAEYYWRGGPIDGMTKLLEAAWMQFCTGIVWAKVVWDPARGAVDRFTPELIEEEGESAESQEQRELLVKRFKLYVEDKAGRGLGEHEIDEATGAIDLPTGDIVVDWVHGFDLTEPFNARRAEESPWLIHSQYRTIEYIRERYGEEKTKDIKPDNTSDAYRYRTREQYGDYSSDREHSIPSDEVLVHELWRPRSLSAPHGFLGVVASDTVLKMGRHPYLHGRQPFITFREMPDPEHFRPGCAIRDLMPLHRARNRQRSYWHGHFQITADPRILNESGSGLPEDAFTTGPKVIDLKDGGIDKVSGLQMPPMPPYTERLDDANQEDMENIGGINRSTRGKAESAQQSGKHAEAMRKNDAQRMTVTRVLFEKSAARVATQLLSLVSEFVTSERIATITGEHGRSEIFTFKGNDIRHKGATGPMDWNVIGHLGPELDINATLSKIDVLSAGGWISPQREKDTTMVKRWLGEHVSHETDDDAYHRANANNENHDIKEGKDPQLALGDDDRVHIDAHEHFTTLPEFRDIAAKSPTKAMRMMIHIRAHQYQFAEKQLRIQIIAKKVETDLVREYELMPPGQVPTPDGGPPPGPPGASSAQPPQSPGPPGPNSGPAQGAPPRGSAQPPPGPAQGAP